MRQAESHCYYPSSIIPAYALIYPFHLNKMTLAPEQNSLKVHFYGFQTVVRLHRNKTFLSQLRVNQ